MPLLTKKDILVPRTLKYKDLSIPEWGGDIRIQELTAAQREEMEELFTASNGALKSGKVRVTCLAMSIVDENGKRLFGRKDIEDLNAQSGNVVIFIHNEILSLNKINVGDADEIEKNSEAEAETEDSSSA